MAGHVGGEPTDDELLTLLGEVLSAVEPLPQDVVDHSAIAAFDSRQLDARLAELVHDSHESTVMRGSEMHELAFVSDGMRAELQFADSGMLYGTLEPAHGDWTVEDESGLRTLELDEFGRFEIDGLHGRLRLVVRLDGSAVSTPWIFR